MKRLLLAAVALSCVSVSAQTINPNQIKPSSTDGQVITTSGGKTIWGAGGGGSAPTGPRYKISGFTGSGSGSSFQLGQTNAFTDATGNPLTVPGALAGKTTNGALNPDLYGGVSNAFASSDCGSSCTVEIPPNSTDVSAPIMPALDGQTLIDQRQGRFLRTVHNPGPTPCVLAGGGDQAGGCNNVFINNAWTRNYARNTYFKYAGPGYVYGFSPNSPLSNNTVGTVFNTTYDAWSRGIDQTWGSVENAHSTGDKAVIYGYLFTDGGALYGSDEGGVGASFQAIETSSYIHATITTGGTTGSTLLTTHNTSGQNTYTDGGFLLDISQGGTVTGTVASNVVVDGQGTWNMTGASMPVSTAWGTLNADSTGANGSYQTAVSQTIDVTLGTSPASPGDFVVGSACMKDGYIEQVEVTAVSPSVAGVQSVTFKTRYGWKANATHIMQGGMCGQFLTNTAHSTWRNAVMAIGSYSPTQVVPAACNHGVCDYSGGGVTPVADVGDSITQYPGAEIIGTLGGLSNTVQLAYNTAPWAAADNIEGPHPSVVSLSAVKMNMVQHTKGNTAGSQMIVQMYAGVNPGGSAGFNGSTINIDDGTPLLAFWRVASQTSAKIGDLFRVGMPTDTAMDFSDVTTAQAADMYLFKAKQTNGLIGLIKFNAADGSYSFRKDTSTEGSLDAYNVPVAGASAQFPLVTGDLTHNYTPVTMSGDATLDATGKLTLKTVSTTPGTCGDATHVCQVTTNGKGLVTNQTSTPITFPATTGFSGTKTAGACVFTISNGLITSVTGC